MSDEKSSPSSQDVKDSPQLQLVPGTIRIELVQSSKWSVALIVLLFLVGALMCIAWVATERSTARILHPESKLSVLELEESVIKFDGIDRSVNLLKAQVADTSKIGICFDGFARLGVDLSKTKFELDRLRRRITIMLPEPEITEVNVTDMRIWERKANSANEKSLDALECQLCNDALREFRDVAKENYCIDTATYLAKVILRSYYKRNYPQFEVEFR